MSEEHRYAKGGYIEGPVNSGPFVISDGEEVIRSDGEVFRFESCGGGYVLKPTEKRYDALAALRALQRLNASDTPEETAK